MGGAFKRPPPPSRRWKIQRPSRARVNQQVKVGVANNDKRAKCWCGTGKVGVATATPAIRHSPPMGPWP